MTRSSEPRGEDWVRGKNMKILSSTTDLDMKTDHTRFKQRFVYYEKYSPVSLVILTGCFAGYQTGNWHEERRDWAEGWDEVRDVGGVISHPHIGCNDQHGHLSLPGLCADEEKPDSTQRSRTNSISSREIQPSWKIVNYIANHSQFSNVIFLLYPNLRVTNILMTSGLEFQRNDWLDIYWFLV